MRRREVLADVCRRLDAAEVCFSEGVVGQGRVQTLRALVSSALPIGEVCAVFPSFGPRLRRSRWGTALRGPSSARRCSFCVHSRMAVVNYRRRQLDKSADWLVQS
jgi:hypothetical protein